jgi:osmoprotectant transport system permease protein
MNSALASEIAALSLEHLTLVLISMAFAIAVAVPAGILITRRARWRPWVMGFANVMQTIPSLALFGFLIPVPLIGGIGKRTAIVALVLYALLPILRNTMVGILGVDPAVRESAVGMGMTGRQLLWRVEVPLAAHDSGRHSRGRRDHHRNGDHCGGHRRRRLGRLHFSRHRVGG